MKIFVFNQGKSQTINVNNPETTLAEILKSEINDNIVVFTGEPNETNATPLVNYKLTLEDYNMWVNENECVYISIYNKEDKDSYNYERYKMYLTL